MSIPLGQQVFIDTDQREEYSKGVNMLDFLLKSETKLFTEPHGPGGHLRAGPRSCKDAENPFYSSHWNGKTKLTKKSHCVMHRDRCLFRKFI